MPVIHVCPLSKIDEVVTSGGAVRLLSLLAEGTAIARPAAMAQRASPAALRCMISRRSARG